MKLWLSFFLLSSFYRHLDLNLCRSLSWSSVQIKKMSRKPDGWDNFSSVSLSHSFWFSMCDHHPHGYIHKIATRKKRNYFTFIFLFLQGFFRLLTFHIVFRYATCEKNCWEKHIEFLITNFFSIYHYPAYIRWPIERTIYTTSFSFFPFILFGILNVINTVSYEKKK